MPSGFATKQFLDFATTGAEQTPRSGIFSVSEDCVFPYLEVNRNQDEDEEKFLVTPICLSGPQNICFKQLFRELSAVSPEIKGGFIQTRSTSRPDDNFTAYDQYYAYFDYRVNFKLSLDLDDDSYLSSLHRYSKYAVRKALSQQEDFSLTRFTGEPTELERFAELYAQTAVRVGFDMQYRFDLKRWKNLLTSDKWALYLLRYKSHVVAGAVVCTLESGYDYTFAANEPSVKDSSRVLLYYVRKELSGYSGGTLDIGGGITEEDSLSAFKRNMGGTPVNFSRCRFGHKALFKNQEDAFRHLSSRWP